MVEGGRMILWTRIEALLASMTQVPDKPEYNILDKFALVLKGTNTCFALYIKEDALLISANTKSDELTKYEEECMLQYIPALIKMCAGNRNSINEVLAVDKRLKEAQFAYLTTVKNELIKLYNSLSQQGDVSEQINAILEEMLSLEQEFHNYIRNLDKLPTRHTPMEVIKKFGVFVERINGYLDTLAGNGMGEAYLSKITKIREALSKIVTHDILFLQNLQFLLENINDHLIRSALGAPLEQVPEAGLVNYNSLIQIPDNKTYHTEHRILVSLNENRNSKQELNHIGISMHCCALCYKIINFLGKGISITGTHGNFCKGDSLKGLKLHTPQEQAVILKSIFPGLEENEIKTSLIEAETLGQQIQDPMSID